MLIGDGGARIECDGVLIGDGAARMERDGVLIGDGYGDGDGDGGRDQIGEPSPPHLLPCCPIRFPAE